MHTRTSHFELREVQFIKGSRFYVVRANSRKGTTAFCSFVYQQEAMDAMNRLERAIQKEGYVTDLYGFMYELKG